MSTFESSHVNKKTQKAIFDKITALNRETISDKSTNNFFSANNAILESKNNPISQQIVRSCFARFSVDVPTTKIDDDSEEKSVDVLAENISSYVSGGRLGNSKQANRPVSFNKNPFTNDENFIWRGETGLTNITVTQKSFFVNEIVVSYTCPDPTDFEERIKPKFLKLGRFAVIEFGWGIESDDLSKEAPEPTMNKLSELANNLETFNERYSGNYQVYCGDVTNYTFKVDENGYYSGTITILSRGSNVLNSTIDDEDTEDKPIADFKMVSQKDLEQRIKDAKELERDTEQLVKAYDKIDVIKKKLKNNEILFKSVIENLENVVDIYLSGDVGGVDIEWGKSLKSFGKFVSATVGGAWNEIKTDAGFIADWFNEDGSATDKWLTETAENQEQILLGYIEAVQKSSEATFLGLPQEGRAGAYDIIDVPKAEYDILYQAIKFKRSLYNRSEEKAAAQVATRFFNGAMEYRGFEESVEDIDRDIIFPIGINDEKTKSRFLVSWGWFEDHILNSFFQIDRERKNLTTNQTVSKRIQSFRSVHKPLYYEVPESERGKIKNKLGKEKNISATTTVDLDDKGEILYSNRCNNSPSLKSLGLPSIILPGQSPIDLLKKYREDFDRKEIYSYLKVEDKLEAERLEKVLRSVDDNFKAFGKPEENFGYIRNMVFDVKYLKSHFTNITSVQDGIRSLFADVNKKYSGYFNFMLKQDNEDTGRVGVSDGYYMNPVEKSEQLLEDERVNNWLLYTEGNKELSSENMFMFDLYTKNTIIRDFDLSLDLSDKAATMAYFNDVENFVGGGYYNPNQLKDLSIERFAALTSAEVHNKEYKDADSGVRLSESKDRVDEYVVSGLKIPVYGKDGVGLATKRGTYSQDKQAESPELEDTGIDFRKPAELQRSVREINNKISLENLKNKDGIKDEYQSGDKKPPRPYSDNGELDSYYQSLMKNNANNGKGSRTKSNYLMNKTIIPINLNLTIDGVGGFKPGNLFRVDYLPRLYRKYCYFQIFTVSHQITNSGWTTSITAKMKLDFPKLYREKILVLESEQEKNVSISTEPNEKVVKVEVGTTTQTQTITDIGFVTTAVDSTSTVLKTANPESLDPDIPAPDYDADGDGVVTYDELFG